VDLVRPAHEPLQVLVARFRHGFLQCSRKLAISEQINGV
jgi:hypothetical protein